MAKGRKLTNSRSERSLGTYSYGQDHFVSNDSPELEEEDVWSSMGETQVQNGSWESRAAVSIPEEDDRRRQPGGLSLAFDDSQVRETCPRILHQYRGGGSGDGAGGVTTSPCGGGGGGRGQGRQMATSAPVNVPDWSKVYRVNSVESMHDSEDGIDEGGESEIVPPHEYLAREYRKMAAKSVFEGAGRTLKGRDMRRVRDAVWSQTGFDG